MSKSPWRGVILTCHAVAHYVVNRCVDRCALLGSRRQSRVATRCGPLTSIRAAIAVATMPQCWQVGSLRQRNLAYRTEMIQREATAQVFMLHKLHMSRCFQFGRQGRKWPIFWSLSAAPAASCQTTLLHVGTPHLRCPCRPW